jgi:osmotically-inducible protein OsmY
VKRRTDAQVLADVRRQLTGAPLDELAVEASIQDGVVTLRGELPSYSERLAAITAAREVALPARVVSEITVAPIGQDYRMTDVEIAAEVRRVLRDAKVSPGEVRFEVTHRVVTLSGVVPTGAERARIRHLVKAARGVHFIDNRIKVGAPAQAVR